MGTLVAAVAISPYFFLSLKWHVRKKCECLVENKNKIELEGNSLAHKK